MNRPASAPERNALDDGGDAGTMADADGPVAAARPSPGAAPGGAAADAPAGAAADAPAPGGAAADVPAAATGPAPDGPETPEGVPFTINDRRFWAKGAADDAGAASKPTYVQQLEQQLAAKEERLQATLRQYKEALEEFEAARARLRRDVGKDIEAGKRAILADLLEVVDNLDRAIEAAAGSGAATESALLGGVRMVRDQFLVKLAALGVRPVAALGQPFDPSLFEAVSTIPVADAAQDGVVVGVVRSCYRIGDETLRYGMVAVGKRS